MSSAWPWGRPRANQCDFNKQNQRNNQCSCRTGEIPSLLDVVFPQRSDESSYAYGGSTLDIATVLDKINGKFRPPSPKSKMGKQCVLPFVWLDFWGMGVCCSFLFCPRQIIWTLSGEIQQCQSVNYCKKSWTVDNLNFIKYKIFHSGNLVPWKCN